jgi:two-component system, OmpR family, sensor kinase
MIAAVRSVPLRVKLVAAVLALVTAALLVISASSAYFLRAYLVSRIDNQLTAVLRGPAQPSVPEGQQLPTDYMVIYANESTGRGQSYADKGVSEDDLPAGRGSVSWYTSHAGGPAFTATSSDKRIHWRIQIAEVSTGQYLAVGQNLTDVEQAVGRLVWIDVLAGGSVLILLALAGAAVVRSSLKPLHQIEQTAAAIAAGDLTQRVPDPEPGVEKPRSELGRLSRALNAMLTQIEAAFTARAESEAAARDAAFAAQASEARARRSEERMRQFIADASHELRTPLTTIRGFAELYRHGAAGPPENTARLVRRIEDEAARMGLLVEDLLLLARLDRERPIALAPVELRVLASEAVQAARAVAPERDISLEVAPDAGPLVVQGDDARLRQVLGNLLSNAITHTPPEAKVAVRLRSEPDTAIVEVADTGEGLSTEQAERVFERFYRADAARSRRDGSTSTGLGLAIVAALVSAHGGTVRAHSTPDEGATFQVRIPLSPDEAQDETEH